MAAAEFYIDPVLMPRAEAAQLGTFLFGGYAGWPNFGDYLQLQSTIAAHRQIRADSTLYLLLDARARVAHELVGASPVASGGGNIVPVYYHSGGAAPALNSSDGMVQLSHLPPCALVHVYGGGFINDWWGRPVRHALRALVERHARDSADGQLRLFMSGLQVSPSLEADAWRPFFAQADYIGARDYETVALVRGLIGDSGEKVQYSGDDALFALAASCEQPAVGETTRSIAAHVNLADYSSADPDWRLQQIVQALAAAAQQFGGGVRCDLLVACPSDDAREEDAGRQLETLYARSVVANGHPRLSFRVRNIFEEAVDGTFSLNASFLVTCSYHVALAGLLSHCPTLLLVERDCYRQKAAGLSEAFKTHKFATIGKSGDVEELVRTLVEEGSNRPPGGGSYAMWIGQAEKALHLSRICLDMDRAATRKQLELTASAFREVAANLGELRTRRILEERLAKEVEEQTAITIAIPTGKALTKYMAKSYWKNRRKRWLKSIQKRLNRLT